jgi:carboxypeptidase family protein
MRKCLFGAVLGILILAVPAVAQRTTAGLRGTVSDASGAVVPGAAVTVTAENTGLTRTTTSNTAGVYSIPDLPVGTYNVTAELQGFKASTVRSVTLSVAEDREVNFRLEVGQVTESVSVISGALMVKTVGGDVSGLVTGQQVRELPLNGRNFLQLATLMPGVSAPDFLNVKDKGLLGGSDISVSGGDVTANMWTVDGANNNDVGSNRTLLVYPSLEAIEEFRIMRNSYGPEFGGAGGAQINIVTRAGTNQFRGSGFYSGRNDALNGTNYFLEQAHQPKEVLKRNDFGGSIGGPIVPGKLQFFGTLEWNREDRGTPRVAFVPTQAERNGDFSGASIAGCTPSIPNDPLTGQPFPGNRIPQGRLSPAGQAFLNLYPLPNVTPSAGSCNNWVFAPTSPIRYMQQNYRVDWNVSNASRVMVRYTQDSWKNNAPSIQSNLWGDDPFPTVDSNWDQPSKSFVASLNQTLGTGATNTLQFSYSANAINITRAGTDLSLSDKVVSLVQPVLGFSGKLHGQDIGFPVFWGGSGYAALWNEAPFHNNQDLYVFKDDYSKVFGNHLVKVGALTSFNAKNEDSIGNGSAENASFWGAAGLTPNGFNNTGNILADFLLRGMTFGFSESSAQRSVPQRWHDIEGYASDSWHARSNVTFDYGVRYSLFLNPYANDDNVASFDPAAFSAALGGDPCNGLLLPPGSTVCKSAGFRGGVDGPNRSLFNQDYNNFAPRVGAAWDLGGKGKTSLRAGIGQFFLRERVSPGLNLAGNPPFVTTITGVRTLDSPAEPCAGCFGHTAGAPTRGRELDGKTPNTWQWNVTLQHELWRDTTLEAGYVASRGVDLLRTRDINQVLPGDINHNGVDDRLDFARSQPANASLRPYGVFGDTDFTFWEHTGGSTYHSLQMQFISRFARGSQFQTSYTLSRSRSNIALTDSSGGNAQNTTALDSTNGDLDWGRPETGRTHIYNASLVWLLPGLEGRPATMRHVAGGWQVGAIVNAATGQPLTVYTTALPGFNGGPSGLGYDNNQRPNRTSESCSPGSSATPEQIINPAAYTLTGFKLGTIGTAERGDCTGPSFFQADLAFYKTFPVNQRVRLQFRWDIFNVFNNTNFLFRGMNFTFNPSSVTTDTGNAATASTITGAVIPANFGQATIARDPRQMQIGFKILW